MMDVIDVIEHSKRIVWNTFVFIILFVSVAEAQTVNYTPNVPLVVTKESDLSFGTVYQNEGNVSVNPGNVGVGKFRIDGQKNLDISVTLTMPSALINTHDSNYSIPYTAQAAFANKGQDNQQQAQPFSLPTQTFRIEGRTNGHHNLRQPLGMARIRLRRVVPGYICMGPLMFRMLLQAVIPVLLISRLRIIDLDDRLQTIGREQRAQRLFLLQDSGL